MIEVPPVSGEAPSAHQRSIPTVAGYEWCLDLDRPFEFLLARAEDLAKRISSNGTTEPDRAETGGDQLNLYLLTCALEQVVSDQLHRHFYDLARVAPERARGLAAQVGRALVVGRRAWIRTVGSESIRAQHDLWSLGMQLAGPLVGGEAPAPERILAKLRSLRQGRLPKSMLNARPKIPHSFREMDLTVDDCAQLAMRAAAANSSSDPVIVVGIRTSGSYMGPLAAATLISQGRQATLITMRPGRPLLTHEIRLLRSSARSGSWALVLDEGAWWGNAVGEVQKVLVDNGFAAERVWLGLGRFGNQPVFRPGHQPRVWAGFAAAPKVVLEPGEWSAERMLTGLGVERLLNEPEMLAAMDAEQATVMSGCWLSPSGRVIDGTDSWRSTADPLVGSPLRRSHLKRLLQVRLVNRDGTRTVSVLAKGAGLGFFGYHSVLVARRLRGHVPDVFGLREGILFERWVGHVKPGWTPDQRHKVIAEYLRERATRLALRASARPQFQARFEFTALQRASRILARCTGRLAPLAQMVLASRLAGELQGRRCVVDGQMALRDWVSDPDTGLPLKVDFEEHGFDVGDASAADPLYDAAAAIVEEGGGSDFAQQLTDTLAPGETNANERLMVYRLAVASAKLDGVPELLPHLATESDRIDYAGHACNLEAALSGAVNDFLAARYKLRGVSFTPGAPIWALDLDGILESDAMGFPAGSPAGFAALKELEVHEQAVVLCSGRSAAEVADRCRHWMLPGGVAEYGAVLYYAGREQSLLDGSEMEALELARQSLSRLPDVFFDARHRSSVRIFRHSAQGWIGIPAAEVEARLEDADLASRLTVVEGVRATDLVPAAVNKARGLTALLRQGFVGHGLVHAVGDSWTDQPLLAMADHAYAPANADQTLRRAAPELRLTMARRARQAGLLEIVHRALHTPMSSCEACSAAQPSFASSCAIILGLQDRGRLVRVAYGLRPDAARLLEL